MEIDECLEKVKHDIESLTKLKNQINKLTDEYSIVKINKKYVRLLSKKSSLFDCIVTPVADSLCEENLESICNTHVKNLLKIEKQLCAILSCYKFEKSKCTIVSGTNYDQPISFGEDFLNEYKQLNPKQLYYFNLQIHITFLGHVLKIINMSTAPTLECEYTLYYIDDEQVDSRNFYGNYPDSECAIFKLYNKLIHHNQLDCNFDDFYEVFCGIVKIFPKLLGFYESSVGFSEGHSHY
jgi:hypothetical protein